MTNYGFYPCGTIDLFSILISYQKGNTLIWYMVLPLCFIPPAFLVSIQNTMMIMKLPTFSHMDPDKANDHLSVNLYYSVLIVIICHPSVRISQRKLALDIL